jgi:hypothetical protein
LNGEPRKDLADVKLVIKNITSRLLTTPLQRRRIRNFVGVQLTDNVFLQIHELQ